jgi:hypothetical protein
MGSIRTGLVEYGKGSELYNFLYEKKLLSHAKRCQGEDDENYRKIYWEVPVKLKENREFAQKIIREVPFKFLIGQLSNWHTFFTKRMFSPNVNAFPNMPDLIHYIYIGSFNNLYRPFLIPLLLLFIFLIKYQHLRVIVITSLIILFYYTILHTIFSATPGHFIRYRVAIEYILFFVALLPIGLLIQNINFKKLKQIKLYFFKNI